MGKSRAPEVDEDGLCDYLRNNRDLKLVGLRNRFAEYEKLRQTEELPVSFIAFEALASLLGAKIEGYSDADLRACWPESWGSAEVTVPATVLRAIGNAWMQYKGADAGFTLGEILGLEGGGQGRKKAIAAQRKRDKHRLYGQQVALIYDGSSKGGTRPTLDQAIEAVAREHSISLETVEFAYKKFGRPLTEEARRRGILKGGKPREVLPLIQITTKCQKVSCNSMQEGQQMATATSILRLPDVEARCAVNRRTLYYWIERGLFPRPINLGPRTVGWLDRDIEAWINEKAQASRSGGGVPTSREGSPNA